MKEKYFAPTLPSEKELMFFERMAMISGDSTRPCRGIVTSVYNE